MSTISCSYRIYPNWFGGEVTEPLHELATGAARKMGRRVESMVEIGSGFDQMRGHFVDFRVTYSSTDMRMEAR